MKSKFLKTVFLFFLMCGTGLASFACTVCEKQQPKVLKGISHGAGPSGNWDYVIIGSAVVVVLATLYYTVKWIINPGEKDAEHIKRTVLKFS